MRGREMAETILVATTDGDLLLFPSVGLAERALEAIDVASGTYRFAFSADWQFYDLQIAPVVSRFLFWSYTVDHVKLTTRSPSTDSAEAVAIMQRFLDTDESDPARLLRRCIEELAVS